MSPDVPQIDERTANLMNKLAKAANPDKPKLLEGVLPPDTPDVKVYKSLEEIYDGVVASADAAFSVITASFSQFDNVSLISETARANLIKQAQILLKAQDEVAQYGNATVPFFGVLKSIQSEAEIRAHLDKIRADFQSIARLDGTYEMFVQFGLPVIDKYLFDGRNLELAMGSAEQPRTALYIATPPYSDESPEYEAHGSSVQDELKRFHATMSDDMLYESVVFDIGYTEPINDLREEYPDGNIPEIVIVRMEGTGRPGGRDAYQNHHSWLQSLFVDYWGNLPRDERPIVILYNDEGFDMPLFLRHSYEGFLLASGPEQFRNIYSLALDLIQAKKKPEFLDSVIITDAQRRLYDNADLREWETETADTYKSLYHLLEYMREQRARHLQTAYVFNMISKRNEGFRIPLPNYTILDCGTGEGRIGGGLARLGFKVMGLDISEGQLAKIGQRIQDEGDGLHDMPVEGASTHQALLQLAREGIINFDDIDLSDEDTQARYLTVSGSFQDLHYELNQALIEFETRFPDIDKYDFFNVSRYDEYAFDDPRDMFMDVSFSMVLFNWHTLCEAGSIDNVRNIFRQCLNVLEPGGSIVIEIPDRLIDPYAQSLAAYHAAHPDEPYGTIRDVTSTEPGVSSVPTDEAGTARFFPDRNELVLLLQAAGFEIDPDVDVQTYLIDRDNPETGKKSLQAKELFITARKKSHTMSLN